VFSGFMELLEKDEVTIRDNLRREFEQPGANVVVRLMKLHLYVTNGAKSCSFL